MSVFLTGFSLGLSLILAIGAQNAFVLRQGLKRNHVFWVCLTCAVSDAVLIAIGVYGFASIVSQFPQVVFYSKWLGAIFLFWLGWLSFRNGFRGETSMEASGRGDISLMQAILIVLGLTWLNPHVYLETVVLIGSVSTTYADQKWVFGSGAMLASFVFFFALGFGARFFSPLFKSSRSWQILEIAVGTLMWTLAIMLVTNL